MLERLSDNDPLWRASDLGRAALLGGSGKRFRVVALARTALPMSQTDSMPRYQIVDFSELEGVACPCGTARRAFADVADFPATVHQTDISLDARAHYHRRLTEVYYILECGPDAQLELDDQRLPIAPGRAILIPPGVRHRAIGQMKVLVVVVPKFDPADEWFD